MAEPGELTELELDLPGEGQVGPTGEALLERERDPGRATVYWVVAAVLLVGSVFIRSSPWSSGEELHTLFEGTATALALVLGALALVRYYSRKDGTYLFIGAGFLGTGLLDAYHLLVSSGVVTRGGQVVEVMAAWSWTASRFYLSLFLFVSLIAWRREQRDESPMREVSVYATGAVLMALSLLFFELAPPEGSVLKRIGIFARPADLGPALLFGAAFVGYLRKGDWGDDAFEQWLLVSLLVGAMAHGAFMAFSTAQFDAMYDAAHGMKVASYVAVLVGLLVSVYDTFRREERALGAVQTANMALGREVSVRREAERILQESEERLQNFLDTAHDLILSTSPEGKLLYVNRAWQWSLGYREEEVEGLYLTDVLHPARRDEVLRDLARLAAGEPVDRMEVEFLAKDGRIVVCAGSATVHRVDGRAVAIQGIFRDVTEQRRAERELAASRANLEALVENTGDAIWSVDARHRLITFNSAYALAVEAQSGREPRQGDAPSALYEGDETAWFHDLYRRALGGARFSELREETVQGQVRLFEIFCNPIHDAGGVAGAVMFGKDVTPRMRAEEALRIAKEEAESANRAKSQFLANMSHELRTPLNSVIGFANILLKNKDGGLGPKEINFLNRILSNGRHLLSLINEVLDLAKIEAGRMELEIEEVALHELVTETLHQLEGQLRDKPVRLVAEVPDGAAALETDRAKLKQVIINLVGNSLKFTHEGSVTVRVETGPDGRTPVAIHVEDTGIGIAPDRLDAVFEAFQQADGSTSRKYGGTGLGLTISRSICLLLGYDLTVDSVVDEGSTFTILIGARASDEMASDERAPADDEAAEGEEVGLPAVRGFSVLVVDDAEDSRTLMAHHLEELGCEVIMARDARRGLELARREPPDLVTLDLMMPEMSGWDALEVFKSDPELRDIPVVVVSVVADEARERLLGAADLLTKPVERADLLRVLWRHLVRPGGGRVLVVEDDADTRALLAQYLTDVGLDVGIASNGREALQVVERDTPDAVILDLVMPVMDGMAFLDELRESPYHSGLPVIVLTAKDLTDEERRLLGEKASGVIRKGDAVEEKLREALGTLFPIAEEA